MFGLSALLKKAFAIISASTTTLFNSSQAATHNTPEHEGKDLNIEKFQKRALKSKLVLKLNTNNIDDSKIVMHTSHSSHSSHSSHMSSSTSGHSSHTSHASHSSHYSSSPSYTPSYSPSYSPTPQGSSGSGSSHYKSNTSSALPSYTPLKSNIKTYNPIKTDNQLIIDKTLHSYNLGSRILFKGCRGTDVKELQELLIRIGYDLTANGYFGETTKTAVIDFQTNNGLQADGKVGSTTLATIQSK